MRVLICTLVALMAMIASMAVAGDAVQPAKFPTDDALRAHMAAIRKVTLDNHTLVTHRRMPVAEARRFADIVMREAREIKANAALSGEAKAEIEALLGEIVTGAEAVAGRGGDASAIDGIVRIDAALARYGERFEDPTWRPLR
jgi:hypothetical protein